MNANKGLTRTDAIIAVACVALVLAQAGIINAGGRERSKREVCLANLRMLTAAWQMYADDNAGKIVNGAPQAQYYGTQCPDCPTGSNCRAVAPTPTTNPTDSTHWYELPWIGNAYGATSECCQKCAINTGALWKYTGDYNIYRCPTGNNSEMITYTILDAANGMSRVDTQTARVWLKNKNQIKRAITQLVFIDYGLILPDSYAVNFNSPVWFDPPPVRHGDGCTVSFSDGHTEYWKWKSQKTVDFGKMCETTPMYNVFPGYVPGYPEWTQDNDDMQDLYLMQIRCWSKLGYTPPAQYPPQID